MLTQLSKFWFDLLAEICPNHFITDSIANMPASAHEYKDILEGRSMQVKKCTVIPVEAIVRGYITGTCPSVFSQPLHRLNSHSEL
jgi:phosphoribosylaminoimidazole-succinocarboxamide synthase